MNNGLQNRRSEASIRSADDNRKGSPHRQSNRNSYSKDPKNKENRSSSRQSIAEDETVKVRNSSPKRRSRNESAPPSHLHLASPSPRLQQLHQHLEHLRQQKHRLSSPPVLNGTSKDHQHPQKPHRQSSPPRINGKGRQQPRKPHRQNSPQRVKSKEQQPQKRERGVDFARSPPGRHKSAPDMYLRRSAKQLTPEQRPKLPQLTHSQSFRAPTRTPATSDDNTTEQERLQKEQQHFQEFLKWRQQQQKEGTSASSSYHTSNSIGATSDETTKRLETALKDQRRQQQNLLEKVQQQQDQIQQLAQVPPIIKKTDMKLELKVQQQQEQIQELMNQQQTLNDKQSQKQQQYQLSQLLLLEQQQKQQQQDLQLHLEVQQDQIAALKRTLEETTTKAQQDLEDYQNEQQKMVNQLEQQEAQIQQLTQSLEQQQQIQEQQQLLEQQQKQALASRAIAGEAPPQPQTEEEDVLELQQMVESLRLRLQTLEAENKMRQEIMDNTSVTFDHSGADLLTVQHDNNRGQRRRRMGSGSSISNTALSTSSGGDGSGGALAKTRHTKNTNTNLRRVPGMVSGVEAPRVEAPPVAAPSHAPRSTSIYGNDDFAFFHKLSPKNDVEGRPSWKRWKNLHKAYEETFTQDEVKFDRLVLMHPEEVQEGRNYSNDELARVLIRPFPSRLFVTNVNVEWNTVFLKTRHTDHHAHRSSLVQIRDAIKADAITRNPPAAKYALTELLNMCYTMPSSDYYSFACTVASAFSKQLEVSVINLEFEKALLLHHERRFQIEKDRGTIRQEYPDLPEHQIEIKVMEEQQHRARWRAMILMDIVFSKLRQKSLLIDEKRWNIYRLVNCMTKYSNKRKPLVYAGFSFSFQICATIYVFLSLTKLDGDRPFLEAELVGQNFPLALCTAGFGIMVALPEIRGMSEIIRVHYGAMSMLAFMDLIVNLVLPVVVAVTGFFVVLRGETFLDGVLNAVALVFITEIDDQLPVLMEMDNLDIVQSYLVDQAMDEYEYQDLDRKVKPIQFSDLHITNTEESGSIPSKGITLGPYEVFGPMTAASSAPAKGIRKRKTVGTSRKTSERCRVRKMVGGDGIQVASKRSVTKDCLLRKVSWQYTGGFDHTSKPRIGHLKLEKLVGNDTEIEIIGKQKATDEMNKPWYSVTGVYIITSFCMSDDILRLRICGSHGHFAPDNFLRAFEYYSLWPLDAGAKKKLKNQLQINPTAKEIAESKKVLFGVKPESGDPYEEETEFGSMRLYNNRQYERPDLDDAEELGMSFAEDSTMDGSWKEYSSKRSAASSKRSGDQMSGSQMSQSWKTYSSSRPANGPQMDESWQTFNPTPNSGEPQMGEASWRTFQPTRAASEPQMEESWRTFTPTRAASAPQIEAPWNDEPADIEESWKEYSQWASESNLIP